MHALAQLRFTGTSPAASILGCCAFHSMSEAPCFSREERPCIVICTCEFINARSSPPQPLFLPALLHDSHQPPDSTFLVTTVEDCSARHSSARQITRHFGHCSFRLHRCLYPFRRVHRFLLLACLLVDIHRLDFLWRVCCLLLWSSVEIWLQTPTTSRKTGSKDSVFSPFSSLNELYC
ncbi:hypothetical protein M438DRAFT_144364 [Aureobasidium pullulans EXF-150]|uniref:Uncharacterized protein n=1 Tax=Aureobasidium pullulans EXF-150 TaxID=1043002 RepID=A0A074XYB4_AURPU|nr:uncharacterized protein M438DRAFT_144364 [Aureobasidium pullulans EXF-150]KEQ79646.1 hypothetical protein M438DRAFT_144364 [Aureobasidium pullulans EXF-150]